LEQRVRSPWRPRVSGISGFLCGPLAAAIITFINLRRLGERRMAFWTIALTVVACAGYGLAVAMLPDSATTALGKVIGNVLSPFLFPLLQTRAFAEWEKGHPEATPDNGWRSSGWSILGLAAFLVIAFGSAMAVSSNSTAKDIEVRYTMPKSAKIGETVEFTISIENTSDHPQLLHNLDIDTHFLDGVWVQRTDPRFKKSEPNLLAPIRSFIFQQRIPPHEVLSIRLEGRAQKAGKFPLNLDVCVENVSTCFSYELGTISVD
jgi:hypothetical protein